MYLVFDMVTVDVSSPEARQVVVFKVYTIAIEAEVAGGHEIARIISHTDPINVNISEDIKSAQVSIFNYH